jgi:hypothetical protein
MEKKKKKGETGEDVGVAVGHEEGGGLERAHEARAEDGRQLGAPDRLEGLRHALHLALHRRRHQVRPRPGTTTITTTTVVIIAALLFASSLLLSLEQVGVE